MKTIVVVLVVNLVAWCSGHVILGEKIDEGLIRDAEGRPLQVGTDNSFDELLLKKKSGAYNQYYLYTRQNPRFPQWFDRGNISSILNSNFNLRRTSNVFVHGWSRADLNAPLHSGIISTFLANQDCNVIAVDWYKFALADYATAAASVPSVGEDLADFLTLLINITGANWNQIHLIGFGMGAHVVGYAGRRTGGRPARITGLDPAGALFENNPNKLDRTDAQYVEVIHTDGKGLGILLPSGDADFYPNRGLHDQPGCWTNLCSHNRAVDFFVETLFRFGAINGQECIDLMQALLGLCNGAEFPMGNGDVNKRGSGIYGLRVRTTVPF